MSAVPANDERPLGQTAWLAVRALPGMDTPELQALLAHVVGHLVDRQGSMLVAQNVSRVLSAARQVDRALTLVEIAFAVAAKHGVTTAELRTPIGVGKSASWNISHPRQEAFWIARQQRCPDGSYRHSLPSIGRYFGGRDHTTVIYGIRAHAHRMANETAA